MELNENISLDQSTYISKVIQRFGMTGCNSIVTPIEKTVSSTSSETHVKNFPYRSVIGALLYIARSTRFDIAYTVSVLSRSLENLRLVDIGLAKRVIRYLSGTKDYKLVYRNKPKSDELKCFNDADFAGCYNSFRSTTGVVIKYAGAAVTWFSRRQNLVADSICEAEIVAANEASKEVI